MKKFFIFLIFLFSFSSVFADVSGCTQNNALNYSSLATVDDGTCFYTDTGALVSVSKVNGFGKEILTFDFIKDYYTFFTGILVVLIVVLFFFALIRLKK